MIRKLLSLGLAASAIALLLPLSSAAASDFVIRAPNDMATLRVGAFIQPDATVTIPDEGDATSRFRLRRARIDLGGSVFSPGLTYRLMVDFGEADPRVLDAYANFRQDRMLQFRFGRDRVPHHHQWATGPANQLFPDRNLLVRTFGVPGGRDVGFSVRGVSDTVHYAVGVYQGDLEMGQRELGDHLYAARLTYAVFGVMELDELPTEATAPPSITAGLGGFAAIGNSWRPWAFGLGDGEVETADVYSGFGDLRIRLLGINLTAELGFSHVSPAAENVDGYTGLGWNVAAGYLLSNEWLGVIARYGNLNRDLDADDNATRRTEWGGGLVALHRGSSWYTRLSYMGERFVPELAMDGFDDATQHRIMLDHILRF